MTPSTDFPNSKTFEDFSLIKTDDGEWSFVPKGQREWGHAKQGAGIETLHNYIYGTQLPLIQYFFRPLRILEIGFGIGIGLKCTLTFANQFKYRPAPIQFWSLEQSKEQILWALDYLKLRYFTKKYRDFTLFHCNLDPHQIIIIQGDALRIPDLMKDLVSSIDPGFSYFHSIFQDPFSTSVNPALWSIDWFQFLSKYLHPNGGVLSTYSASGKVRKNMTAAGLAWFSTPGVPPKRSITIAKRPFQ